MTSSHTARIGIALLVFGVVFILFISAAGAKSAIENVVPKEGISVFAVAYILAQFIERIVEPWSEKKVTGKNLFGDTNEIKNAKEKIIQIQEFVKNLGITKVNLLMQNQLTDHVDAQLTKSHKEIKNENDKLEKESSKRVYTFWGLTSLMGMLLVYFTIGLFETAGITFQNVSFYGLNFTGHALDSILSGVIVGAGTKPLHDLIGYLEKAKG